MLKISVLRFTYEARVYAVFSLFAPGAGNIDVKSNGTSFLCKHNIHRQ